VAGPSFNRFFFDEGGTAPVVAISRPDLSLPAGRFCAEVFVALTSAALPDARLTAEAGPTLQPLPEMSTVVPPVMGRWSTVRLDFTLAEPQPSFQLRLRVSATTAYADGQSLKAGPCP
jgi:hypothetical protein